MIVKVTPINQVPRNQLQHTANLDFGLMSCKGKRLLKPHPPSPASLLKDRFLKKPTQILIKKTQNFQHISCDVYFNYTHLLCLSFSVPKNRMHGERGDYLGALNWDWVQHRRCLKIETLYSWCLSLQRRACFVSAGVALASSNGPCCDCDRSGCQPCQTVMFKHVAASLHYYSTTVVLSSGAN